MLIVSQNREKAYNLGRYDALCISGEYIVLERDGRSYSIGRYSSEEKAGEVLDALLNDLAESSALPFEESANPYWLPSEG